MVLEEPFVLNMIQIMHGHVWLSGHGRAKFIITRSFLLHIETSSGHPTQAGQNFDVSSQTVTRSRGVLSVARSDRYALVVEALLN